MPGWLSFVLPLSIYMLTLDGTISTNGVGSSIIGMQYAMWKFGSFSLGVPPNLLVNTVDYAVFQGKAYSAIAPGAAILSYPFAAVGFSLGGGSLVLPGPAQVADEAFLAISASVAVYFVYRICRLYAGDRASLLVALAVAFATPVWPFATVVFENAPSLMLSVVAVYCVLRSPASPSSVRVPFAGGLLLGLASLVEYAAGLFVLPLAVFLRYRTGKWRSLLAFAIPFSIGPIADAVYNFALFGNPLIFPEQLKSGTAVPVSGLLSSFDPGSTLLHVLLYLESPYRGVVFLCPIMVFGFYALYRDWSVNMKSESLLFLTLFCLTLVFYSSWSDWAGGLAYGPRFLTVAAPYALVPIAPYLEREGGSRGRIVVFGLIAYSSLIQGAGALTSAFSVIGSPRTFQPLALNLPWLVGGRLDSWWISWGRLGATVAPLVFVGMVYLVLWGAAFVLSRGVSAAGPETSEGHR